ncbi:MAG: MarR family winged helix-turn-helix transcriptional regulator [Alcaligenaceae bacterium]|nr:MarR family winged helix-turn-helix transcriptional regulator [Alcaligenaceae bacterium]
MKNDQLLGNQLCHRLYFLSNAITRRYKPLLDRINLTYPQYVVMMALWEVDNVTVGELHRKTQIDNGCLSLVLKKMVNKKVISLVPNEKDRRVKHVRLTQAGRDLQQLAQQERLSLSAELLSEEEFNQLVGLLDKLSGSVFEQK